MRRFSALFVLSAVVLLALSRLDAVAQSPRMTLIEEGTNASCPPCASQNPTFEKYLEKAHISSRVIPLIYHASWPGRDVMYSANTTMHTGRIVGYYAISGVPTITVNGKFPTRVSGGWDGAPADTVAINNVLTKVPAMSPITITVNEVTNGATVDVAVQVNSTDALQSKTLQIAVVEGHHYYASAGTNGEKDFYYIARLMLPGHTGQPITLGQGETKTFNHSFTIDTSWNANEMYVVAFVQDDGTKEVLQAGSDKIELTLSTASEAKVNSIANPVGEFDGTLTSPVAGQYEVSLANKLPAGWTAALLVNGNPVTPPAKLTLEKNVPLAVKVQITPADSKNRLGSSVVTIKGPRGGSASAPFRLYARDIDAFVMVKDEGNEQIAAYYQAGLDRSGYRYALAPSGDENAFDLKTFGVVVCEVGKTTLSQGDVQLLKSFIDRGGLLFMIGAEVAWGLVDPDGPNWGTYQDAAFLRDYLHAGYVQDDNPGTMVKGVAGDPIGDGFNISFTSGIQNQDTPDELTAIGGSVPVFYYGSTTAIAGIRYSDAKSRLVYFGFGLEGISLTNSRGEILRRGISWLLGTNAVDETPLANAPAAFDVYPNPTAGRIDMPVAIARASHLRASIHDLMGREVAVVADRAVLPGTERLAFDTRGLAAGTYALRVLVDGVASARLLTVTR